MPAKAVQFEILSPKTVSPGYLRVTVKYAWEPGVFNTDTYDMNCNTRTATFQGVLHTPMGDAAGLVSRVCCNP